jgi:hypothetical protein
MFDFLRPNKALERQLELTQGIASTLSRINLQLGMIIENQNKAASEEQEPVLSGVANSTGDVTSLHRNWFEGERTIQLPKVVVEPTSPAFKLLFKSLKGNTSKMLGESIVDALRRHGRSMESLANTYTGWSRQDLESVVYELERMGLLENHVNASKVKGISAMRRIYVATGKHYDWSKK